ncbi:MAG: hypothetical protein WDN04_09855 [Rhodospirillales bacterium]
MRADPAGPFPDFDADTGAKWESFLPLTEPVAAMLRALLGGSWHHEADEADEAVQIGLEPGFILSVGAARLDLATCRPAHHADGGILLVLPDGPSRLRPRQAARAAPEIHLRRSPPAPPPRRVTTEAEFLASPGTCLMLPGSDELCFPPLTASLADRDWVLDRAWPAPPRLGRQQFQSCVVHEAHKFVLLERGVEGMVFDNTGISSEPGYLSNLAAHLPPHFGREAGEIFLSAAALQGAPVLRGPHAVF